MSKGKVLVWVLLITLVLILLTANFRFIKTIAKAIFNQAKSAFTTTEIDQEKNRRDLEKYKVYLNGKDLNSIFIEWGSKGYESLNNEVNFEGKKFSLDDKIIIKINKAIKELDITQYFQAGDSVKIIYEPYSIYIFIERYQADYGDFIFHKEKIDIRE